MAPSSLTGLILRGIAVSYVTQLIPAKEIDDHDKIRALIYQALVDGAFGAPRSGLVSDPLNQCSGLRVLRRCPWGIAADVTTS